VVTRRSYGFRTYEAMEIALYHNLGRLPEPESTHRFCWGGKKPCAGWNRRPRSGTFTWSWSPPTPVSPGCGAISVSRSYSARCDSQAWLAMFREQAL